MQNSQQHLVIATGNAGKVKEFLNILGGERYTFLTLRDIGFTDDIVEDADSFQGNALLKARAVATFLAVRFPDYAVLADDSGLEVDALGGAPGIFTARYAGVGATDEQNYRKLLDALEGNSQRGARFRCCLCYMAPGAEPRFYEGECRGEILPAPVGGQGFGYDPVFRPLGETRSFAQMEHAEKKALSHRGAAIRKMQADWAGLVKQ